MTKVKLYAGGKLIAYWQAEECKPMFYVPQKRIRYRLSIDGGRKQTLRWDKGNGINKSIRDTILLAGERQNTTRISAPAGDKQNPAGNSPDTAGRFREAPSQSVTTGDGV